MAVNLPKIKTFRIGPKNKRLEEGASDCVGYSALVETDLSLPELMEKNGIEIAPDETQITPETFPWSDTGKAEKYFELFDFSFRSDYGRSGVDEAFVREKLQFFKFQPATLVDLVCFGGHLREAYREQWFESKKIIALGSVLTTTEVLKKATLFSKEVRAVYRHYPELEVVAGRPLDQLRLSKTERDKDGNWPTNVLFLATTLG